MPRRRRGASADSNCGELPVAEPAHSTPLLPPNSVRQPSNPLLQALGGARFATKSDRLVTSSIPSRRRSGLSFTSFGAVVGTLVSALFLFGIAIANILVWISIYRTFQTVKNGCKFVEEDLNITLAKRGFLGRLFRRFLRMIERSWQMFPLGVLFGLGFDTATEVGLLGISATQASQGLSIWSILVFPALFTAGMTLIDTTDSILMLGAYGWAFVKPIGKLYYNLTITAVSVIVAVVVGGLETLNLIGDQLGLTDGGGFWGAIGSLNDNFGVVGFAIVAIFVVAWLISYLVYRAKRYDEIEVSAG
jgi:nickel/cobalt transporter (NiCoT) family protein